MVRRLGGNRPQLILGFRRRLAAQWIRANLDPKFLLASILTDCNDEEALVRNVTENRHRLQTTPIDDARNARRFSEAYGYEDVRICEILDCDESWLRVLRKLLMLPSDIQKLVADGRLAATFAANKIASLGSEEEMRAAISDATDTTSGKVSTAKAANSLRAKGNKVGSRTLAEAKKFFTTRETCPVSHAVAAWLRGEIDDETMAKRIDAIAFSDATTE
jgi:ParB family chromosome partitioning protein